MSENYTDEDIARIAEASKETVLRTVVYQKVAQNFKSSHYVSSKILCDCIVLNIILNRTVTPSSSDKIITSVKRIHASLFSSINSAYKTVEDKFDVYARCVLADDYNKIISLKLNTVSFLVYVISFDIIKNCKINRGEVLHRAYTYEEFMEEKVPTPI